MRGVTCGRGGTNRLLSISTHTPHARRDFHIMNFCATSVQFQLTRLMRGVTVCALSIIMLLSFQLTRLMRGVTGAFAFSKMGKQFQLTRLMRGVTACTWSG